MLLIDSLQFAIVYNLQQLECMCYAGQFDYYKIRHTQLIINMLKSILNRAVHLAAGFKVDKFNTKDYQTMCSLIKQRYPIFNEALQINKDVKLVDEKGKLIGQYSASQARRKATTMKKDIILVNSKTNPVICKLDNFRESVLQKFYSEIVQKRNESLMKKASTSRQLKIATNLGENDLQIKSKQVIELAKKNFNVRVYSICKNEQKQEGLAKFDSLKSSLQNNCIVEKDISVSEFEQKDEFDFSSSKSKDEKKQVKYCISMTVKSKQNEFTNLIQQSSQKDPESALQIFLKRYYRQEDVEMRDLQASSQFSQDVYETELNQTKVDPLKLSETSRKKQDSEQKRREDEMRSSSYIERQAKARILNYRLKKILDII